jgi:hypothetical protein
MTELSGIRIPLTDRPAAVAELRQNGMSTRAIGSALGISKDTVARELATVSGETVAHPEKVISLDGRERPAAMPARQDIADAALAAIDEAVQRQPFQPTPAPRIEPPDPAVRERLDREREEQTSREVWSRDVARCVWLLAEFGRVVDAADKAIKEWQPSQDIYPTKTTADRLRAAADYLNSLAERWPQ